MKKSELWAIYIRRNPSFAEDGNVTLSARGLKKLFDTTWEIAMYDGEEETQPKKESSTSLHDLMSIFNMK